MKNESQKFEEQSGINALFLQGGMVTPIAELSITLSQRRLRSNIFAATIIGIMLFSVGGIVWAVSEAEADKVAILGYIIMSSAVAILGAAGMAKYAGYIKLKPLEKFIQELELYINVHNDAAEMLHKTWIGKASLPAQTNYGEWKHSLEINKEKWAVWASTALALVGNSRINSVKQNKIRYLTELVFKMRTDLDRRMTPDQKTEVSRGGLSLVHSKPSRL